MPKKGITKFAYSLLFISSEVRILSCLILEEFNFIFCSEYIKTCSKYSHVLPTCPTRKFVCLNGKKQTGSTSCYEPVYTRSFLEIKSAFGASLSRVTYVQTPVFSPFFPFFFRFMTGLDTSRGCNQK